MRFTVLPSGKLSRIAWATFSVASVQMSMSSLRRSSSVIRPMSYWSWIFSALPSNSSRMPAFAGGATTSPIAIVTPERVAQW